MKTNRPNSPKKKLNLGKSVVRRLDADELDSVQGGLFFPTITCLKWGCEVIDSQAGHSCVDWC